MMRVGELENNRIQITLSNTTIIINLLSLHDLRSHFWFFRSFEGAEMTELEVKQFDPNCFLAG